MTFIELCRRVAQECGYQNNIQSVLGQSGDLKRFVDWTNRAYLDICNEWTDWKFLWREGHHDIGGGVSDYAAPEGLNAYNEDSFYLDGHRIESVSYDAYRRDKRLYDGGVDPVAFCFVPNGMVRYLPAPENVGRVDFEYWLAATPMTENQDVPLIPAQFHAAIVWRARLLWAQFDDAQSEIQTSSALLEQAMKALRANQLPSWEHMHNRAQGSDIVVRAV